MVDFYRLDCPVLVFGLLLVSLQVSADGEFEALTGGEVNWANAGHAPNFRAYCEADLPPDRLEKFNSSLTRAEGALESGDLEAARSALQDADGAAYRGGSDLDYSVSRKCLGEAADRRYFNAELDYHLQRQALGETNIPVWVIAAASGSQGIVDRLQGDKANRYGTAYGQCNDVSRQLQQEREYGAFVLSEEEEIIRACADAALEIQKYVRSLHDQAMAAEDVAFNRDPTPQESALINNMKGFAASMGSAVDPDAMLARQRVDESIGYLNDARDWNLVLGIDDSDIPRAHSDMPESQRAVKRGNEMLSKAEDTSLDVLSRDDYYAMAIDYYDFGYAKDAARKARASRESIQVQVAARQQEADDNREAMQAEMEGKLENAAEAMEDMKKTDAEKKSFNEEADALEAELGF